MVVRKTKAPVHGAERGLTADELPATRRMLADVRTELLLRIDQTKEELKAEIHGVRADIHAMQAEIHGVKADVARISFLIEEQNARNKVVLDALSAFMDRQTRGAATRVL
ncbi:MAG TPA: hypothetical protein VLS89_19090 [Candidatus Nanopelagicales bacterium]|nr:hypothetical protein [Candidatus Nanopelagicales bacterium]